MVVWFFNVYFLVSIVQVPNFGNVDEYPMGNHWMPQYHFCNPCHQMPDNLPHKVINLEDFHKDAQCFLETLTPEVRYSERTRYVFNEVHGSELFNARAAIQNLKRTRMFSLSLEIHVPNKLGSCSPSTIGEQEPCCRTKLPSLGGNPHHHPLLIFDIAHSVLHQR